MVSAPVMFLVTGSLDHLVGNVTRKEPIRDIEWTG